MMNKTKLFKKRNEIVFKLSELNTSSEEYKELLFELIEVFDVALEMMNIPTQITVGDRVRVGRLFGVVERTENFDVFVRTDRGGAHWFCSKDLEKVEFNIMELFNIAKDGDMFEIVENGERFKHLDGKLICISGDECKQGYLLEEMYQINKIVNFSFVRTRKNKRG